MRKIGQMGQMGRMGPMGPMRPIGLMGLMGPIGLIRPIVLALMLVLLTACGGGGSDSISGGEVVPPPTNPTNPEQGGGDPPYSAGPAMGFSAVFADSDEQGASSAPRRGMTRAAGDPQPGDGEFTTEDLQASGFGVYCWYTGSKDYSTGDIKGITKNILMLNQKVEWKDWNGTGSEVWGYTPIKYWPLDASEKLTLRAYAPYVSYQLQMDDNGMPWVPVVVTNQDYHYGQQHDPLWGTSKHGGSDDEETKYGRLYNNYTYEMSGSSTSKDARDGTIDWYFHHGMSKLMFQCTVVKDPGCSSVTIKSITIEKLYTQGLLSLSSLTSSKDDKPDWKDWNEPSGDMTVTLNGATKENEGTTWTPGDLAPIPTPDPEPSDFKPYPFVIDITDSSQPTGPFDLLSKGLLIIPREFTSGNKLKLSLTYTIDNETEEHTAKAEIEQKFEGNTTYTLKMNLTPSTEALEITLVQSAFTPWGTSVQGDHEVYNW